MATVNKDFRVKNGLVVEGSTATVNSSNILTEASTEFLQDTAAAMLTGGSHTNISVSYNDTAGTISLTGNVTYTDENAQDAINSLLVAGTGISKTYDDVANTLTLANTGVTSVAGTANEVEVSSGTGAVTIGLPNDITIAGNVTINGTPSNGSHAVTKSYVDNITAGLNFHAAVHAATTANLTATYANGTNGYLATLTGTGTLPTIDGETILQDERVLVKAQTDSKQNGIYTLTTVSPNWVLTRAADADNNPAGEIATGDFTFVQTGTANGGYGYIMSTAGTITIGTSSINYTQFNAGQSVVAGNGLQETTPGTLSINTGVTVDLSTSQTLSNKTLTSPIVTGLVLNDASIVFEGTTADAFETTLTVTDPTADRTITFKDATGTVAFTSDVPSSTSALSEGTNLYFTDERAQDAAGAALATNATHTGVSVAYNDATNAINITNTGVTSITGTTNQITASASTGGVTLSLPQSINTSATPTFGGLTVGSITLTDALAGTATASATTSATTIDTWAVATYSAAKYFIQMKRGTDIEIVELLVAVDGNNNVYVTQYGDVISNTALGTVDAVYSSGNVLLQVTGTAATTTVKVHKTLIKA